MRNKGLPYLVVLFSLILSNLSYALTGYKTGLPVDQYYLYSATWDGSKWDVSTTLMKVVRDPSSGLNVEVVKTLTTTGSSLPAAPNQTKSWYLTERTEGCSQLYSSKCYASDLNNALQSILPNILKSQNDTSSRVAADLSIRTSDGKEVHYIASYDGNNGYRSYGFQVSAPNLATFVYYSKKLDTELPPPPSGSQLVQDPSAQSNLGKYYYVIYKPNGEIIKQETVDVNGRYDSIDDTGLNKFINEVVLPKMRDYDVGLSIVRYMYNIRPTLNSNGQYQYYVTVPYREVSTSCDTGGNYDASTGKCKAIVTVSETSCYIDTYRAWDVKAPSCIFPPGYFTEPYWSCGANYWNIYTEIELNRRFGHGNPEIMALDPKNYPNGWVCWVLCYRVGNCKTYTYSVEKTYTPYVTSMYEKIVYNYATEADVKVYAVSINGDRQFLGFKTEPGYSFNFTVDKRRSDLLGQKLTPNYFTDKIISIKNNVFDIVRYTDEGVASVGSLVIK